MADEPTSTGVSKVFAIPELLEHILVKLDVRYPHQLFVMQRVNSTFKGVIESSKPIRQAMYLEASEEDGTIPKINPLIMTCREEHPRVIFLRPQEGAAKGTGVYDLRFEKREPADEGAFQNDADGYPTTGYVRFPPTWNPAAGSWRKMVIWNKKRTTEVGAWPDGIRGGKGPNDTYKMGPACTLKDLFDIFHDKDALRDRASKIRYDEEGEWQTYVID
jgi:hypothetical protein